MGPETTTARPGAPLCCLRAGGCGVGVARGWTRAAAGMWVVLYIRVPLRFLFTTVPYYTWDLNGDPNLENYLYGVVLNEYSNGIVASLQTTEGDAVNACSIFTGCVPGRAQHLNI